MEFIVVTGKYSNGNTVKQTAVVINGELNGYTGCPIKLDAGSVEVSLPLVGAASINVNVENTTPIKPMHVEIVVNI